MLYSRFVESPGRQGGRSAGVSRFGTRLCRIRAFAIIYRKANNAAEEMRLRHYYRDGFVVVTYGFPCGVTTILAVGRSLATSCSRRRSAQRSLATSFTSSNLVGSPSRRSVTRI